MFANIPRKTSSQQVIKNMRKELKKFAPHGASQRQFHSPPIQTEMPKRKLDYDDYIKQRNPTLHKCLEGQKPKDIHARSPDLFCTMRRGSTLSPNRVLSNSPIENFNFYYLDRVFRQTSTKTEEPKKTSRKNSPNLEIMNEIITSCNEVKPTKIPKKLKKYSKEINKLVNGIDMFLVRRGSKE